MAVPDREISQWLSTGKALAVPPRGPGFNSQYPSGGSQLSTAPVPGYLMPSDLHWPQTPMGCIDVHVGKTSINVKQFLIKISKLNTKQRSNSKMKKHEESFYQRCTDGN